MSKQITTVIAVILIVAPISLAQSSNRAIEGDIPHGGTVRGFISLWSVPFSLKELVDKADLIIEGSVESVLSTRYTNPDMRRIVETDLEVSVKRVFKGPKDKVLRRVIISQIGGKLEDLEVIIEEDPLMHAGENYFFFLTKDNRSNLPDYKDTPRYVVTAVWYGKFKIENNKINPSSYTNAGLKLYEGKTVDQFVDEILATLDSRLK